MKAELNGRQTRMEHLEALVCMAYELREQESWFNHD